jgi:hypothetical protein
LRILVTPTDSLGDLVDYLRRCGCIAEIVGFNAVEASPLTGPAVSTAYSRMELDAYLRVWLALHRGVEAELLGPPMSVPAAATPKPRRFPQEAAHMHR